MTNLTPNPSPPSPAEGGLFCWGDDGTCDYCFCGPGTEYSVEAGQCLVVEGCTDFNDDGCTGTQDLLHLLSNFGNCEE